MGTRLHCLGYLATVVSSECARTKASTAAFIFFWACHQALLKVIAVIAFCDSWSHIFISRPQAERLADLKSPHLSAVTQQTVQAVSSLFKNLVSFLIWTYCRKQTAGKGLTQKTSYWRWYLLSVSPLCTAWPFAGCVIVGEIPQRGHDSEF